MGSGSFLSGAVVSWRLLREWVLGASMQLGAQGRADLLCAEEDLAAASPTP